MPLFGMLMAARTLSALSRRSDVMQNNLANQSTEGFKFDRIIAGFDPATGVPSLARTTDLSQGSLLQTDNPFHMALRGPGFFVVDTPNGERLTRNGSFQLIDGMLVDNANRPLLGEKGPIVVNGDTLELGADGTVSVDGTEVNRIRIVNVQGTAQLNKEGISLFNAVDPLVRVNVAETQLVQGHVEESNMNAISGIGDLIEIQRNFAMTMGALTTLDSSLGKITNNVGQV